MDTDVALDDASAEVLSIDSTGFHDVEFEEFVPEEQPAEEAATFALPTADPSTRPAIPLSADHLEYQPFAGAVIPAGGPKSARPRAVHATRQTVGNGSAPNVPIQRLKKGRKKGGGVRVVAGGVGVGEGVSEGVRSAGVGVDLSVDAVVDCRGEQTGAKGDDLPPVSLSDRAPRASRMRLVRRREDRPLLPPHLWPTVRTPGLSPPRKRPAHVCAGDLPGDAGPSRGSDRDALSNVPGERGALPDDSAAGGVL